MIKNKFLAIMMQGEICNFLGSEKISKSFLSHIGKNKLKL
jgi:hypothetical protein